MVDLRLAAGEVDELTGVGDVARRGDTDVVVGLVDLLDRGAFHQRRPDALVDGENDAVARSDADTRCAAFDRFAGVFDLVDAAVRRETAIPGRTPAGRSVPA